MRQSSASDVSAWKTWGAFMNISMIIVLVQPKDADCWVYPRVPQT